MTKYLILILLFICFLRASSQKKVFNDDSLTKIFEKNLSQGISNDTTNGSCIAILKFKKTSLKKDTLYLLNEISAGYNKAIAEVIPKALLYLRSTNVKEAFILPVLIIEVNERDPNYLILPLQTVSTFINALSKSSPVKIIKPAIILNYMQRIIRD